MFKFETRLARVACCMAVAGLLTGCATVTRGSKQTWTVQTEPSGAAITTSNGFSCSQSPCTFKVKRKANFDVTIQKPGYKTWKGAVKHQTSGGGVATTIAGNALVGGLIGLGVDAASGATQELKPNPLVVKLETEAPSVAPAAADTAVPASAPVVSSEPHS